MAVLLGELPIKGVLAYIQANIAAQFTEIEAERGDSLDLMAVTQWFGYERPKPSPEKIEISVYSERDMEFPEFAVLTSRYAHGQVSLHNSLPITIKLTHRNRDNASRGQMQERNWRYTAALARLFRDNPTFGIAGGLCVAVLVNANDQLDPADQVDTGSVTIEIVVLTRESSDNEGTASGGVPPSAIIEQV